MHFEHIVICLLLDSSLSTSLSFLASTSRVFSLYTSSVLDLAESSALVAQFSQVFKSKLSSTKLTLVVNTTTKESLTFFSFPFSFLTLEELWRCWAMATTHAWKPKNWSSWRHHRSYSAHGSLALICGSVQPCGSTQSHWWRSQCWSKSRCCWGDERSRIQVLVVSFSLSPRGRKAEPNLAFGHSASPGLFAWLP